MNDIKENFIQLKDDLALTGEERALMRSELARLLGARTVEVSMPSPYLRFFMEPMRGLAMAALVLVVAGGATSTLAEGALPGDTLYALKVGVNEKLERSFAGSPEDKAVVDIRHAEERLTEVELLAAKGETDADALAEAEAAVEDKVQSAVAVAETLSEEGNEAQADSIHTRLNATLLAHAGILDAQAEGLDEEPRRELRALSFAVSIAVDTASDARENMETEGDRDLIQAVVLAREDDAGESVRRLDRELRDERVPAETRAQLDAELARVQADYGSARELSVDEKYREAGSAYEEVGRRAARALAILESAKRIEDETGKEVVVAFDGEPIAAAPAPMAKSATPEAATAMTMMMAVPAEDATTTEEDARMKATERPFQFLVRDRVEEGR